MDRAASAVSAGAAALACRSSVDARVVQPGEACVGMEVDVKFDQGEVYRGKILLMAKKAHGEEEKAEVVIEFGDPRNELIEGEDAPWVLPDPDVTFPAKGFFACCDCGLTRKDREA